MSSDKRECVFVHALWDWIDQKMNQSDMRNEEIKELGLAGGTLALEEAGFRRALHAFMDDVLDDDSGYIYDLNKEKEEEEEFRKSLDGGTSILSDGHGGAFVHNCNTITENIDRSNVKINEDIAKPYGAPPAPQSFGLTDDSFESLVESSRKVAFDDDDDIPF